ncbi:isoprenylcysteine carboxylmethyltransferase family protein [Rhodoferax sp. BAB1]|uniref:methyltransferase family protein n=1 Tax=Rhodoferax sp. BAB1 TaxID=2741720 RepID=UPI00157592EF|nr:isoprenylcysteine carboxylmethyltransferase family protein [Rhodoferax sp. BAB1]QKO21805.1 isoprenylcysteine carboxylmethyltransferase family protein [Rhodoferax sp. BAB1]
MNERQRLWLGSGLVLLQFGLLAVLALLAWPAAQTGAVPLAAWAAAAGALLLFGWTLRANRLGNFNIHPRPRVGGTLVTSGPYAWIRHPMYTAFLLGTFALARTADGGAAWLAWWALSLVLWFKSTLEERWMLAQHPGYAHYREQTKRFVPWVY